MWTFTRPKIDDDDPIAVFFKVVHLPLQIRELKIEGSLIDFHA